jgi:alpha-L-fucosidase 2
MVPSKTRETNMRDKGGLYMNLFCAHPPFQIDGNFGATSGITEMLLQSHLLDENGDFFQDILPALPSSLASGRISGLKGRGGFEFSISWENGKLVSVEVRSLLGNKLNLRYAGKLITRETSIGETYSFAPDDF